MKLYLDPGHGGSDTGAQGNGLNEKDVTLDIALQLRTILLNYYEDIEIRMSRTSDTTKGLSERTNEANSWGADFYLSIHVNSDNSNAQGYEDYIFSGLSDTSATAKYQNIIHTEVIKVNQLKDRGRKQENFHVLRQSSMPALLTENGFIDNFHDAALMKQSAWRTNVAQGHANGIARAFNLKRKTSFPEIPGQSNHPNNPLPGTLFKVIAGSFQSKENAEERVTYLRSKGFQAFVNTITISEQIWYRVQAGAYAVRGNADQQLSDLKKAGINDAFLVAESVGPVATPENVGANDNVNSNKSTDAGTSHNTNNMTDEGPNAGSSANSGGAPGSTPFPNNSSPSNSSNSSQTTEIGPVNSPVKPESETVPTPVPNTAINTGTVRTSGNVANNGLENAALPAQPSVITILGPSFLSPEHMNLYVNSINPDAPELGNYYQTFGNDYGIRSDVAFAQAMLETNFFRFTGAVQPHQNNFAGLGSTTPSTQGAFFKTAEDGVLAQFQHLFAYATTKPLPGAHPLTDTRFHLVDRGSAPHWTDLNGKWAYPGTDYGQSILNLYQRMIDFTLQHLSSIRSGLTS